jgi:hypothetical protein
MLGRELANQAKAEVDRIADREERKAWMEEIVAEREAAQERMERQIKAIVHSIRAERDEKILRRSENVTERQEMPKEGATVASLECVGQKVPKGQWKDRKWINDISD